MAVRNGICVTWTMASILGMVVLPVILKSQEAPAPTKPANTDTTGVPRESEAKPPEPSPQSPGVKEEAQKKQVVQIFKLKHVRLGRGMQEVLEILNAFGRIAIDERTNSLVVQTTEDMMPTIASFLSEFDTEQEAERPKEAKLIRLVWLVSGLEYVEKQPPQDLEKVVVELAKFGIADLRMVAQTIIQTTSDGNFGVSSNPTLGKNTPCSLNLNGQLLDSSPERNQVQVKVTVASFTGPTQSSSPPLSSEVKHDITTTISAPSGHPIVLCVSPTESAISVFVIQVITTEIQ